MIKTRDEGDARKLFEFIKSKGGSYTTTPPKTERKLTEEGSQLKMREEENINSHL